MAKTEAKNVYQITPDMVGCAVAPVGTTEVKVTLPDGYDKDEIVVLCVPRVPVEVVKGRGWASRVKMLDKADSLKRLPSLELGPEDRIQTTFRMDLSSQSFRTVSQWDGILTRLAEIGVNATPSNIVVKTPAEKSGKAEAELARLKELAKKEPTGALAKALAALE